MTIKGLPVLLIGFSISLSQSSAIRVNHHFQKVTTVSFSTDPSASPVMMLLATGGNRKKEADTARSPPME